MKECVIVGAVRTPIGRFGGSLKDIGAIDLGALVVKEAVRRVGILPDDVDEVIVGQVGQVAENGFVARAISLKAGMPEKTTAYSVNRQCGSGLQAIADGGIPSVQPRGTMGVGEYIDPDGRRTNNGMDFIPNDSSSHPGKTYLYLFHTRKINCKHLINSNKIINFAQNYLL